MGNRVFFTIEDKNGADTYYQHWSGGLDTFLPITKAAFDSNLKDRATFVRFLEECGFNPEKQSRPNTRLIEENGHYIINLKDNSLFIREEIERHGFYDIQTRVAGDLFDEFNAYFQRKIKPEYHETTKKDCWDNLYSEATKFFHQSRPKDFDFIKSQIEVSPYCLTTEEKTMIKRKIKELLKSESQGITAKVSIPKSDIYVVLVFDSIDHLDKDEVQRLNGEMGISSLSYEIRLIKRELREKLENKIRQIIEAHQVVYKEKNRSYIYSVQRRIDFVLVSSMLSENLAQKVLNSKNIE
jgi:hypothetical protein